ncbi:T-cell receptor gamma chain V region PT-gamma-1/2 [Tupaia chinensis]|nr:T-cell receptor gamma chain V region PT-gamma-1/2 [Tupaia chinensis]
MPWALVQLLAFLASASQVSSNLEGRMIVTGKTGSTVVISCNLQVSASYIHWYQFQEGKAPRRLLYLIQSSSKVVMDSGIRQEKYQAYKTTGNNYELVLRYLENSDSGMYYCAFWPSTVIQTCLVLHRKCNSWLVYKIDLPHLTSCP